MNYKVYSNFCHVCFHIAAFSFIAFAHLHFISHLYFLNFLCAFIMTGFYQVFKIMSLADITTYFFLFWIIKIDFK